MEEQELKKQIEDTTTIVHDSPVFKEDPNQDSCEVHEGCDLYSACPLCVGDLYEKGIQSQKAKEDEFIKRIKTICPNTLFNKEVDELAKEVLEE